MTDRRRARLVTLELAGPAGALEALLQVHDGSDPAIAAIVCHPHPLYGGTLHNKVVHRIAAVLEQLGAAVLRFNFRGVGRSAGQFDQGKGELEDARYALGEIRRRFPGAAPWVAGFSFGAWIGARLAAAEPAVARLILVAPPVRNGGFEMLESAPVPKLVIQGAADDVCPPELLAERFPTWAEPKQLILVEGATHFFDKRLGALSEALLKGLRESVEGGGA